MAQNGKEALRLLLPLESGSLSLSLEGADEFDTEWFEMIDVGVGYNETEKEEQDGMFVITEKEYEKPDYCTRKAPFRVYEALRPLHTLSMEPRGGRCALYLTLSPKPGTAPGTRKLDTRSRVYTLSLTVRVYGVTIPEETLHVTNWFNLDNIALFHGIEMNTPAYFDMLRKYARAMRRTRQNAFLHLVRSEKSAGIQKSLPLRFFLPQSPSSRSSSKKASVPWNSATSERSTITCLPMKSNARRIPPFRFPPTRAII